MANNKQGEAELIFIIYPETYTITKDALKDRCMSYDAEARNRLLGIVASWETALQEYGDSLAKVELFLEDGNLTFNAFERAGWRGELGGYDEDE